MTNHFIITFALIWVLGQSFGQVTTTYYQGDDHYYSFKKNNPTDTKGTFYKYAKTDEAHQQLLTGVYEETNNQIYLTFNTTNNDGTAQIHEFETPKESINIKWFDEKGQQQKKFSIKYADTTKVYETETISGVIEIPKADLRDKYVVLSLFKKNKKIAEFEINSYIDEIDLFAIDTSKKVKVKKEILMKNDKGFLAGKVQYTPKSE